MTTEIYKPPEIRFSTPGYRAINQARWNHLEALGIDFKGKVILEVGAATGDHTDWLLRQALKQALKQGTGFVYATEARPENLEILDKRFACHPMVKVGKLDMDNISLFDYLRDISFDIVYCYGLLYHLSKPSEAIHFMSYHCSGQLLIDTAVSYMQPNTPNITRENPNSPSHSPHGAACRPGRVWLFKELQKHFPFVYMPITQPDHEQFPLDWTLPEQPFKLVRSIYIASRVKIDNPGLIEEVPMKQISMSDYTAIKKVK